MPRPRDPGDDDDLPDLAQLARLDQDFKAARPATTALPDGHYPVRVEHVEVTTSRCSGKPMLRWTLRVLAPGYDNRRLWKTSVLSASEGLAWLKHDLALCGLELDKLSDLPARLDALVGVDLDVTKRTRDEWENVHFNRRLSASHAPAARGA